MREELDPVKHPLSKENQKVQKMDSFKNLKG